MPVCIWCKMFYWLLKKSWENPPRFYSFLVARSTNIFLIFPPKINGNIGINSWNSTDLAGIFLKRWEKFLRHVGGIYHQIQTGTRSCCLGGFLGENFTRSWLLQSGHSIMSFICNRWWIIRWQIVRTPWITQFVFGAKYSTDFSKEAKKIHQDYTLF